MMVSINDPLTDKRLKDEETQPIAVLQSVFDYFYLGEEKDEVINQIVDYLDKAIQLLWKRMRGEI